MTKRSYVQIDGVLYEKGTEPRRHEEYNVGFFIQPDLPDFVSPIDGTVVNGRAGMREHCLKHDVVPTAELKGLKPPEKLSRNERIEDIRKVMIQKGYL